MRNSECRMRNYGRNFLPKFRLNGGSSIFDKPLSYILDFEGCLRIVELIVIK